MLNGWKQNKKKRAEGKKDYRKKLGEHRDRVARDLLKRTGLKAGQRDKRLRGLVSDGTRILGKRVEADLLSEGDALLYLPPDSLVSKSKSDNRWRLQWAGFKRSRSWSLHGEVDALAIAAKFLWAQYTRLQGVERPWEFINVAESD